MKFTFTPREEQVVRLTILGYENKVIAQKLGVQPKTVKRHLGNVFVKTGTHNRTHLSVFCILAGLIDMDWIVDNFSVDTSYVVMRGTNALYRMYDIDQQD